MMMVWYVMGKIYKFKNIRELVIYANEDSKTAARGQTAGAGMDSENFCGKDEKQVVAAHVKVKIKLPHFPIFAQFEQI